MSSSDFIFTSYCFDNSAAGGDYKSQQIRQNESIRAIYPEANIHWIHENEHTGKPRFQRSLYGFKVSLIRDCIRKGFAKIIFFDVSVCLEDRVDHWLETVKDYGVLSAVDRQKLKGCTSDRCVRTMNLTEDQLNSWHLTGGSVYVFDFTTEKCQKIFDLWQKMESQGLFGTQDDLSNGRLQNHRMDETCMAIALYLCGSEPLGHDVIRYAYEHPEDKRLHSMGDYKPIIIKRHFK